MALGAVKEILTKAAINPDFRAVLFSQPDSIFGKYDLTEEEKQCLKEVDENRLSDAMRILDKRDAVYTNDIRI